MIFNIVLGRPKFIKIEPWGAKGTPSAPRLVAGVVTCGIGGRGAPRGWSPEWWLLGSGAEGRLARGIIK